jgi:hypothetical protein
VFENGLRRLFRAHYLSLVYLHAESSST